MFVALQLNKDILMHFGGLNCPKPLWASPQRGSSLYLKKKKNSRGNAKH